jgi:16S rRNA (cytidine1402-2'-O)-methyltransferase
LLKEQKPLKFFTVDKDRMHDFARAAKAHGLLFCPIRDKMDPDHIEIAILQDDASKANRIIEKLQAGESVALISDAGTPGISDPGARIVAAVREAGCRVIPLPGPCAATTALSASGLLDEHFLFYGFLPAKSGQRRQALEALSDIPAALVFYEAPHRVLDTVADLATVFGQRTLVIGRELTKLFETIHSLPLPEALDWLKADPNRQRGEFVLMLSGASGEADSGEGERVLKLLLADGLPTKQAAKLAASITGASKNALYDLALSLKAQG